MGVVVCVGGLLYIFSCIIITLSAVFFMSNVFRICFGFMSLVGGSYALAAASTYEGGSFRTTLGVGVESYARSGVFVHAGIVSNDTYAAVGATASIEDDQARRRVASSVTRRAELLVDAGLRSALESSASLYFDYGASARFLLRSHTSPATYTLAGVVGLSQHLSSHSLLSFHQLPFLQF